MLDLGSPVAPYPAADSHRALGSFTWCCTLLPTALFRSKSLEYWKTIDEDYHWHIEILPVIAGKAKSYTFKEVYYSPVTSETAVKRLREATIEG